MPTWTGWQNEFLNRAGILPTPPDRQFLSQWADNAHSSCVNNPIDLSVKVGAATHCANNTGIHPTTWRYPNHADAATAFSDEIHQPWAKALLDALNTGNPYQSPSVPNDVASVLVSWGSAKYANAYLAAVASGVGGGGGGGGPKSDILNSWHALRRSVNNRLPTALHNAHRNQEAAWRSLSGGRKVRL